MAKELNGEFTGNLAKILGIFTIQNRANYLNEVLFLFFRKWKRDYLNDTSKNGQVDEYRNVLNAKGINPRNVLFSAPTKKFNRHGKVSKIQIQLGTRVI